MTKDKYWEDYWTADGKSGEVFVNKNGTKPKYLDEFWGSMLNDFNNNTSILDIACGGGSIFTSLPSEKQHKLYGADISNEALTKAKQTIPALHPIQCDNSNIPLENESLDYIVSQFGIEYSGVDGFLESVRLLKKNGKFVYLTHCKNGLIDTQNSGKLDGALLVKNSNFINIAIELTTAIYNDDQVLFERKYEAFSNIESNLYEYSNTYSDGVHAHLYNGYRKMLLNRNNYTLKDIVNWLIGMKEEVDLNIARLKQMRSAALSKDFVDNLKEQLISVGLKDLSYQEFLNEAHSKPIGWILIGHK